MDKQYDMYNGSYDERYDDIDEYSDYQYEVDRYNEDQNHDHSNTKIPLYMNDLSEIIMRRFMEGTDSELISSVWQLSISGIIS